MAYIFQCTRPQSRRPVKPGTNCFVIWHLPGRCKLFTSSLWLWGLQPGCWEPLMEQLTTVWRSAPSGGLPSSLPAAERTFWWPTLEGVSHPIFTSTTEFHPSWWGCEERVSWSSTMWKHFAVMSTMKHSECPHLSFCAPSPSLRPRSSLPERLLLAQNGTNTLQLFVPSHSFVAMQFYSPAIFVQVYYTGSLTSFILFLGTQKPFSVLSPLSKFLSSVFGHSLQAVSNPKVLAANQ